MLHIAKENLTTFAASAVLQYRTTYAFLLAANRIALRKQAEVRYSMHAKILLRPLYHLTHHWQSAKLQ